MGHPQIWFFNGIPWAYFCTCYIQIILFKTRSENEEKIFVAMSWDDPNNCCNTRTTPPAVADSASGEAIGWIGWRLFCTSRRCLGGGFFNMFSHVLTFFLGLLGLLSLGMRWWFQWFLMGSLLAQSATSSWYDGEHLFQVLSPVPINRADDSDDAQNSAHPRIRNLKIFQTGPSLRKSPEDCGVAPF